VREWKLKMFIDVCLEENFERKRQVAVHVVEGFERPWEEGEGAHVGSRKKKMKCFKFCCLSFCYWLCTDNISTHIPFHNYSFAPSLVLIHNYVLLFTTISPITP
jgi:hypothetical protein